MCLVCNRNPEDIVHALVKYPLARSVWCQTPLGDLSVSVNNFANWWQQVMRQQRTEKACMSTMIVWSIWNNHNNLLWNEWQTKTE